MGEPQAAAVGFVSVDRQGPYGDIVFLMGQLAWMGEMDRALLIEIAGRLNALGRYMTAEWLLGEVFGSERDDVCRAMLAGDAA